MRGFRASQRPATCSWCQKVTNPEIPRVVATRMAASKVTLDSYHGTCYDEMKTVAHSYKEHVKRAGG